MTEKPFEITRWESPKTPDPEFLARMLGRENLTGELQEMPAGEHTIERKYERDALAVVVSGRLQVALPGSGVVELGPGDMLEIRPHVLHDLTVVGAQPVQYLLAFR